MRSIQAMPARHHTVVIPSTMRHLATVRRFVRQYGAEAGLTDRAVSELQLAVDEACANAIEHGYKGREDGRVQVGTHTHNGTFVVTIRHDGEPFDPGRYKPTALQDALQNHQRRGYGMRLIHRLVDEVSFDLDGPTSQVRLAKRVTPPMA
ncbi:MAG: ATP-binding protein [Bacteroidota bacterium]